MGRSIAGASDSRLHFSASSIAKSERDVTALKQSARFVVVLGNAGEVKLISNPPHSSDEQQVIPLIAVVAKVGYEEVQFWASVAEIGYGRTRPYRRVHVDKNKVLLQHRHASWQLSVQQLQQVYSTLLQCLETVLIEVRSKWKSDEPWFVNGDFYERGVQITVNQADRLLCQAVLRESVRYFGVGVFSRSAEWINWKLRYSQFVVYGNNQYGPNVRLVADKVVHSVFAKNPFWFEVLMRHVSKRRLLENALLHLYDFRIGQNAELTIAFGKPPVELPAAEGLFLWHTLDQPSNQKGSHADNCSRFEVLFDRNNPNSRGAKDGQFYSPVLTKEMLDDSNYCPF